MVSCNIIWQWKLIRLHLLKDVMTVTYTDSKCQIGNQVNNEKINRDHWSVINHFSHIYLQICFITCVYIDIWNISFSKYRTFSWSHATNIHNSFLIHQSRYNMNKLLRGLEQTHFPTATIRFISLVRFWVYLVYIKHGFVH